jgi:hypothetical protein
MRSSLVLLAVALTAGMARGEVAAWSGRDGGGLIAIDQDFAVNASGALEYRPDFSWSLRTRDSGLATNACTIRAERPLRITLPQTKWYDYVAEPNQPLGQHDLPMQGWAGTGFYTGSVRVADLGAAGGYQIAGGF